MLRKSLLQCLLTFSLILLANKSFGQRILSIQTDPRIEALSIFFTLATADTLETKPTPSSYYRDVQTYFKPFNNHPSLNWYRKLENWDGPDMASLGIFLTKKYPYKLALEPEVNYIRNSPLNTFLRNFNAFYKDCRVEKFLRQHRSTYKRINKKAIQHIKRSRILKTVESFYKVKQSGEYVIYTDFLCNHGSNAISSKAPEFSGKVMSKAGYIEDKSQRLTPDSPVNFKPAPNVVAHECSHIYLKNFVKNYHDRLFKIRNNFLTTAKGKKLADEQWENEIDELLVRVCVAKIMAQKFGKESGEAEIANQALHFKWAKDLYFFMDKYTENSKRYQNIEAFYPELIVFLETKTKI